MRFRRGIAQRRRVPRAGQGSLCFVVALLIITGAAGCATRTTPDADTAADIDRTVLENLDLAWHAVDQRTERPATAESRWVLPTGWGFVVAQCMVEAGYEDYDFSVSGGFISGSAQPELTGRQALAWYSCSRAFPIYSTAYARLSDNQAAEFYDYYVRFLIPCLESNGARVAEIPTEKEFLDGGAGDAGSWNPYLDAARPQSEGRAVLLFEKCPAYPG